MAIQKNERLRFEENVLHLQRNRESLRKKDRKKEREREREKWLGFQSGDSLQKSFNVIGRIFR